MFDKSPVWFQDLHADSGLRVCPLLWDVLLGCIGESYCGDELLTSKLRGVITLGLSFVIAMLHSVHSMKACSENPAVTQFLRSLQCGIAVLAKIDRLGNQLGAAACQLVACIPARDAAQVALLLLSVDQALSTESDCKAALLGIATKYIVSTSHIVALLV